MAKNLTFFTSTLISFFSNFSSSGGAGGRGRGRGLTTPPPPIEQPQPPPPLPSHDHGRGAPRFPDFHFSSSSTGRGRGGPPQIPNPEFTPKKPIFLNLAQSQFADPDEVLTPPTPSAPRPPSTPTPPLPIVSGAGRGKPLPASSDAPRPIESNRHASPGRASAVPGPIGEPSVAAGPKLAGRRR